MVKSNYKKGQKQPPKATLDLTAKDITDKDKKAPTSSASSASSKTGNTISSSPSNKTSVPTSAPKTEMGKKETGKPSTTDSPSKTSVSKAATSKNTAPSQSAKATPKQAGKKSGGGFFSNLISAVVGGVVALFGMSFAGGSDNLMKMAGIPAPANTEITALKQQIEELKSGGLSALEQKFSGLETATKSSSSSNNEKIAKMEATLNQLSKIASGGGKSAIASAGIVKRQLEEAGVTGFKRQVLNLRNQNTAVQEEQAKLHEGMTSLAEEQAKLHTDIAKMLEDTAKLKNSTAKIKSQIAKGPDLTVAMAPLLNKIKGFESQISAVQTENKQAKSEGRNIALAIELSNLKRVFSRGQPFDLELARIKSHIPKNIDIALLEEYASKGLPNIEQLNQKLSAQMSDIMASEIEVEDNSQLSWQERLLAKAKSAVKMRPAGNAKGNTTDAILARVEYKLSKQNDLRGALNETKALKEKPASAAKGWVKVATDKLAGDQLLQQIEDTLIGALAGK